MKWHLQHHVRAASAEAVSFCRTFGDEAWSQQKPKEILEAKHQRVTMQAKIRQMILDEE
jgi:hypothetical protein